MKIAGIIGGDSGLSSNLYKAFGGSEEANGDTDWGSVAAATGIPTVGGLVGLLPAAGMARNPGQRGIPALVLGAAGLAAGHGLGTNIATSIVDDRFAEKHPIKNFLGMGEGRVHQKYTDIY